MQSPQEIDPARQQLVEQLKSYRKAGDRAGEAAIWQLLDPSLTYISKTPSEKPSDVLVVPFIEAPPDFQVEWRNPDIPVFTSSNHETHPVMDFVRSGTNYPTIFSACELWSGTTAPYNIRIRKSADHGMSWPSGVDFSMYGTLGSPQIKQISPTQMGIVYERWFSSSDPDVRFYRTTTDFATVTSIGIDDTSAVTVKPYITSDVEDYGSSAYLYVAYYKITNEPWVNPSQPYRYDLMFTRSYDKGDTWTTPTSLGAFRSASGAIPVYCSIDYEDDTLYLAYIGESTRDIRVRRSTDFGSNWSSPTILTTGDVLEPEIAVADPTHAIVFYTAVFTGTDEDPHYYYTNYFTMWSWGYLSGSIDLQNSPVVRHYDGRYYVAFRDSSLMRIYTRNAPAHQDPPGGWTALTNVKNSSYNVSWSPRPVNLIAKPEPSGAVGSAAIWIEDIATADGYFDGSWQPFPVIRTPISNISFGNQGVGIPSDMTTRIYNDGNGSLTINSITRSAGSTYFTYQGPSTPFSIGAGSSQVITIRFAPGAVGSVSATFTVSSNDPDTPSTTFSASGTGIAVPDIRTPITSIAFGNVNVGSTSNSTTTIYNDGSGILTVNAITRSSGSAEFTYVGPTVPFNIAAGGSQVITLRFAPTSVGSKSAVFNVNSNDPDEAIVIFNVTGTGLVVLVPDIRTPITDIGFGNVLVGSTSDGTTTIYNDGSGTLTVNAITRTSGSTEFTYVGPTVPFNIAAAGSQVITLRFTPTTDGSKSAVFNVNSNDPDEANVTFNVTGMTMGLYVFDGHDFNGDGSSEVAIWRPSNGYWFVRNGAIAPWGTSGDIPANGDYDGDGTTDIAVWRPSIGYWFIQKSGGGTSIVPWGTSGDIPVPGDYDGDTKTDIAVWRPSIGYWFIQKSGGGISYVQWGTSGDIPVPGKYDSDTKTDIAVWRPSNGFWFVQNSAGGVSVNQWGTSGDIPVPERAEIFRFPGIITGTEARTLRSSGLRTDIGL